MRKNLLELGGYYSKEQLALLLNENSLKTVREGIYYCKGDKTTLLFVDLEKEGKEERFKFRDYFEGEYFHWESQTTQHIKSPKIQEIVTGAVTVLLFARIQRKIKSKTQPFVYCGVVEYVSYDDKTSKPTNILFKNMDYNDSSPPSSLAEIYYWKPDTALYAKNYDASKAKRIAGKKARTYSKPNETERKGLITTRVGQGYYRSLVLEKWSNTCSLTKCVIKEILIASHIVPWSESTDEERLDVDNGILLSPNVDALFDRHLVSFEDNGRIMISHTISKAELNRLGLSHNMVIPVSDGMKKYLKRHRQVWEKKYSKKHFTN